MTCSEFRERHPADSAEGRDHLSSCTDCRAFAASWKLLGEYPEIAPKSDFVRSVRRKLSGRVLRFAAPLAAAAAALLLSAVVFFNSSSPADTITEEERELVENLELLENYELLTMLEWVSESGTPLLEENN